jgi:penicillin-binding protein 1A
VLGLGFCTGAMYWRSQLMWADEQLVSLPEKLNFEKGAETVIYARDGKTVLYSTSKETRDPVEHYDDIPLNVIHATLAAEDKRYFDHSGVDYYALCRSIVTDVRERRTAQGGSTITMQLVKRLYTSPEKTFTRKVRDVALAVEIEKKLTKPEILQDYLNQVFYGNGAYGIKAASEVYFNKPDMNKLTIGEAALLARLVRKPSDENPYKDRKKSISNRNEVLATELEEHWITQDEYEKAVNEKLHLAPKHFGSGEHRYLAPYFVNYILDYLKKDMPEVDFSAGGYQIQTTLDPSLEKVAENQVLYTVEHHRNERVTTGAFVLMNSDGEILAMVGGIDYEHHQYNAVVQGRRQPGSSFKPIVYSVALTLKAISPGDSISGGEYTYTDPYSGKEWNPQNDNGPTGFVSIPTAIAQSINTCAARVCEKVGPENVVSYAHSVFGYTSPIDPVLSIALGSQAVSPLEQAQAYSIFQSHGDRATPYGITRVLGPDNQVIKSYGPNIHKTVLDPEVAAFMDTCLRGVVTGGTATRARVIDDARGKTGTTQDFRDAWFCGYTNNLIGIAWVANEKHDPSHNPPYFYDPMAHVFGGHVPTEMWVGVMRAAQEKYGKGSPPPPAEQLQRQDMEISTSVDKATRDDNSANSSTKDNSDNSDNSSDNSDSNTDTAKPDKKSKDDNQDPNTPDDPATPPQKAAAQPPDTVQNTRPRRKRTAATEMVTVEVCADTGMRATAYCPETIAKSYVKGTEPTQYCTKHRP